MDWPAFWTAVFASSGAALVGFTSAVWVFWRTRVADRRDTAARERRERIARLHAALWGDLGSTLAWRYRPVGRAPLPLAKALADIIVAESGEHPAVALWTTERMQELSRRVHSAERWWLLPGDQRRRGSLLEAASTTASLLAGWENGLLHDDWFAARLSDDNKKLLPVPRRRFGRVRDWPRRIARRNRD